MKQPKVKKWRPGAGDPIFYIDSNGGDYIVESTNWNPDWKMTIDVFRTRSLAEKALKDIKKLLKNADHG